MMAKNIPARERPALRSRSSYSNPQRAGGVKTEYKYPGWVTQKQAPPADIAEELRVARGGIPRSLVSILVGHVNR